MTEKKIGVLVFPAGEINSVELHDALSTCVNIRLYGASSVERHGEFVFKNYIGSVPNITETTFVDAFNKLLQENNIDVVMPTHDDVALFLAQNQESLKAKVLTCDIETAEVCRDKKMTFELFSDCGFCPKTYGQFTCFPVFIKPRRSQGGVGAKIINGADEISDGINLSDYVICEYLAGDELTVDCFTDKDGALQAVLPRSRQRVFGGVSVRGRNEPLTKEIEDIAVTINSRLRFLGLWYFQIKRGTAGNYRLLEISTRCAGTMCLSRALGVNLPLLSVYAATGRKTEILKNAYDVTVDRTLISRYKTDLVYDRVYIDLDDTIVANDRVNLQAMRFLYQCANERKSVSLITKHRYDHSDSVTDTLKRCKISEDLFDEIIEIEFARPKYKAMEPSGAIFIDNAYAERKAVYENLNIPVFDVDGLEVLLDWRT
jgi:predicted ATP-grasp superfamily ATP-dependent carboligase